MRILSVGLGALGTVFSCFLQNKGHEVWALDREDWVNSLPDKTVKVTGIWGDKSAMLSGLVSDPDQLEGPFDLVMFLVKSFDTASAIDRVKEHLGHNTRIILAQNGYGNYETAQNMIPKDNLIVGRVIFGAETLAPGFSKVTVIADDVVLGSPEGLIPLNEVETWAAMINEAGVPCRASTEVMKYLWGKILYNSALNSLGAILEVNYGTLAAMNDSQKIMNQVINEIFTVLSAMKETTFWPDAASYQKDFYDKLIPPTAGHHASMLQDIQRGRKTEIDALNGAIVKLGEEYGVPTPVNRTITDLVKSKEKLRLGKFLPF